MSSLKDDLLMARSEEGWGSGCLSSILEMVSHAMYIVIL